MNHGDRVKITKIAIADTAKYRSAGWDEWVAGSVNPGMSPPVEYEVVGRILYGIRLSHALVIDRESRNGVVVQGLFQTSAVQNVIQETETRVRVETYNSVYMVELINESDV